MTQDATRMAPEAGALTLLRLPCVIARTGISRSTLYRMVAAGDFPRPIRLTERASAWSSAAVDAWIASKIAASDQGAK